MDYPHKPVLLNEVVAAFADMHLDLFVDATLGLGGHAEALIKAHPEMRRYVGIDQDLTAIALAEKRLLPFKDKIDLIHSNFNSALDRLLLHNQGEADGILIDLGVSSMQLDVEERGFSFRGNGPLDMRMDRTAPLTAEDVVNTYSEEDLGRIFRDFGEEKQWRKAASFIVKEREKSPLKTTRDLASLLENTLKIRKPYKIHPATLIFQAIRIEVNKELKVLAEALPKALSLLKSGGRMAVISFHSLEDRIVKQFFQRESLDKESTSGIGGLFIDKEPRLILKTKKPIEASEEEIQENPRSRSAKLRVAKKR